MGTLPSSTESLNGDVNCFGESLSSNGMRSSMNTCVDVWDVYVYMCASVHSMLVPRIRNARKSAFERASGVQRVRGVKQSPALTRKSPPTCVYFVPELVSCVPVCMCDVYVRACARCRAEREEVRG